MNTKGKIIFYLFFIIIIIVFFVVIGISNNKTIYSKYIGNIGSNEIDKQQNDTLFNNIFKANMGSNIVNVNKKKEALINKSFCNFDNNDSFNNDCIEIKKLIKDSNDINISNDPDHEILLKIYNSNKAIAEQTNQKFDDMSGCSMLINHILASQDKTAWDDISKVLKKIKNQYEGLNIFLTCQILKLTTFYSNVGDKEALDWNPFNWGNIQVLNWYKCCKGNTIVNSKIIFYIISLISSIYIYGHWYLWLYKYRNDNKILKFDIKNDTTKITKLFTLISIILIIITLLYIPSSITNSIDNKVIIPTAIISIVSGIIISSILLFLNINNKPRIILGIYVLISFSLFLWYTIDSQKNFNEDNCNKCDDEKLVSNPDDKPLCVSKLNNKDYGGLTINNETGDIYINNKKIKNYSNNQVDKLWILILTSILISIIFGIISNFTNKFPIFKILSQINKIILAILFESINLFALFFYPIFIIVIMVFQRLVSSKLFNDNTWYPPFMILIKLYEDSITSN